MKIRLHGTVAELDAGVEALKYGFEVRNMSRPYPDRAPSTLQRVYVDAEPRPAAVEKAPAAGIDDANTAAWMVAEAAAARAGLTFVCRCGHDPGRHPLAVDCGVELRPTGPGRALAPRAEIEDRKAARDLLGELDAITAHWAAMEAQPWWPPQPGDVAIGHPTGVGDDRYGETFVAVDRPALGVRFESVSRPDGYDYAPADGYAIEDLWFEWPAISIIRAGVIHPPQPARKATGLPGPIHLATADPGPGRAHRCADHLDHIGGWPPYECLVCGKRLSQLDTDEADR